MAVELTQPRVRQDADVLYDVAFAFHGAVSLDDARDVGRDWRPRSRVSHALELLVRDGFAELRHRPSDTTSGCWYHLTNAASVRGWTRATR